MVWASVVMLCLLVVGLGWAAVRVAGAGLALSDAAETARQLPRAVAAGDLDATQGLIDEVSATVDRAAQAVSDPVWGVAETMPWLGDDVSAVGVITEHGHALTTAIAELRAVAAELVRPPGNGAVVDVVALADAHDALAIAADAATAARAEIDAVESAGLIPPIASGVRSLRDVLDQAEPSLQTAAAVTGVLPGVLGADGPRTLLVMLQNNAELRTGGGITGSFALLTADRGALTLHEQADSSQFRRQSEPIMAVPEGTTSLYGDDVARFVQNASMTADFAVTGALASAWWSGRTGTAPDAVLSLDPLVVRALLEATGPIPLADGSELTAENLVDRLLVQPYVHLKADEQTVFLQGVTDALFAALTARSIDPLVWARALAEPVSAGRLSLWSPDAGAQAALSGTVLGGAAARHSAAGPDAFAVYFNDTTGGKMDVFLQTAIEVQASCRADGRAEVTVALVLDSEAPVDAGQRFPPSVTGGGLWGLPPGQIGTIVSVSAPDGWSAAGVQRDGAPQPSVEADEAGFATSAAELRLDPGQTGTLVFRFVGPVQSEVQPRVLHTPTVHAPTIAIAPATCG
ncbi:DUF4012 domain-containing protein [Microbacterium sp. zg.Y625]|uniref:DUF4012 domain-containing protein n=1 Tax=Microbacterium jiangjiandongii TaxID=3049071 RepID=UPI00214D122E|nr:MULTISPECIES: DUF4012 domain-containing protein [unclassified Microbacterium]MCR2792794.1 DUF4012 domain-containing protein [Microbacterium sp. zg.Y625]WIM26770.1 DUF4012 domain-containing protein [Microbacterium sp. zg-Y625]